MMDEEELLQLSVHVSKELEKCGFSRHKLEAKSSEVQILEHLENDGRDLKLYATGSNAEGVDITGSDRDTMLVVSGVCAVWSTDDVRNVPNASETTIFLIECVEQRPCYARLRLLQESTQKQTLFQELGGKQELCTPVNDHWYLSSEKFVQQATRHTSNLFQSSSTHSMHAFHVHGPCATFDNIVGKTTFEADFAYAIPCYSAQMVETSFMKRQGNNKWPTKDVIEFAREVGGHLVAVGSKVTESADIEWRISFALLERELVWSLSDMQCKCYVLLKMLSKQFIEPLAPEQLSSYLIKTALMWVTEERELEEHEDRLLGNVLKCLKKLCACVQERMLPHFIVPENNLLLGKFEDDIVRTKVIEKLTEMTTWHWSNIFLCPSLSFLRDLWEEFQPDVQSFFRHARHPNLKPLLYKDVVHYRSVQSMYLSLCSASATPPRHRKLLQSLSTLHPSHDDQTVSFLAKVICNRLLFPMADVDESILLNQNAEKVKDEVENESDDPVKPGVRSTEVKSTPAVTSVDEATLKMTQNALHRTSENGQILPAAKQFLSSKFDVCTLLLQIAVKFYLKGDYDNVYECLQLVMAAYKPQVLYLGLCGPEEIGEFDFIEYLCYITSSENLTFEEKISKCLTFDYVICRSDPILPILRLELALWTEPEVPLCIHPRVLIHYLMFLVHLYHHRLASARASLSYLVLNVQGTAPGSQLYGHVAWNLVGHGYFLVGKPALAMRAFRASLKVKATNNPAIYYIGNC